MAEAIIKIYDSVNDRAAWLDLLGGTPDVYFRPEWLTIHLDGEPGSSKGTLFSYQEGDAQWYYPFILRELPKEYGVEGCDIESAYGYGGPIVQRVEGTEEGFVKRARMAFEEWCVERQVVAEFCSFHPLFKNEEWMGGMRTLHDRNTVSLDLSNDDLEASYSSDGRYMIRRGKKEGIEIVQVSVDEGYAQFVELYLTAMKQMKASAFYLFNDEYFHQLGCLVKETGFILAAMLNGKWVAASLFLYGDEALHYHLSANHFEIKAPGATNMLLHHAALLGREKGLKFFHYGGGRSTDEKDSLFKFKRSMGSDVHQYIIGKSVHNQVAYDDVIGQWETKNRELVEKMKARLLRYRI